MTINSLGYSFSASCAFVSGAAVCFMLDLERNKNILNEEGFIFGHSRLAVNFESRNGNLGCNYCGLCLYGCPYKLIYSSFLKELLQMRKFF